MNIMRYLLGSVALLGLPIASWGFAITSPQQAATWSAGQTATVTWNVGQSNQAPIFLTHVNIWYSVDGGEKFDVPLALNTPNDGSQSFPVPNTPSSNGRIRIEGVQSATLVSQASVNIQIQARPGVVATPVISPGTRSFTNGVNVIMTCATDGAKIYYTTNGNIPMPGTTFTRVYTGPFGVFSTTTVRALAMRQNFSTSAVAVSNLTHTNQAPPNPAPQISPVGGTYSGPQTVTLTATIPGSVIYYTTSGNVPSIGTSFTHQYTGPFTVPGNTTVRAISKAPNGQSSAVAVATYTIENPSRVALPVISPGTQVVTGPQVVTITCATPGAIIYFTTTGNEPRPGTTFTRTYTGPFTVSGTTTVRALASRTGMMTSPVAVSYITFQTQQPVATPVISPGTGFFSTPQLVTISTTTPGATLYYTVSGNTPVLGTGFTRLYTGPFMVSGNTTVRAMATAPGMENSAVAVSFISVVNLGGGRVAIDAESLSPSAKLSVYPNPARDRISVAGLEAEDDVTLRIFNSLGLEVKSWVLRRGQRPELEIGDWDRGMYFIRREGSGDVVRFLKQ